MNPLLVEENGIRRFADANIQSAVDSALSELDPWKKVAVVAHATNEGWKLSAAVKLGDKFSIMAAAYDDYQFDGTPNFEAKAVWTPF